MNFRLLSKLLGILSLLIGLFMLFSLAWANPRLGFRTDSAIEAAGFEWQAFRGMIFAALISTATGLFFLYMGRAAKGKLFRKEAMAVVGLSWLLATILGALPFVFSETYRGPSIRMLETESYVLVVAPRWKVWQSWNLFETTSEENRVLRSIVDTSARGLTRQEFRAIAEVANPVEVFGELQRRQPFEKWLVAPGQNPSAPADRASNFRLNWYRMGLIDSMFESQSGFSTTGATVLSDLEDSHLVPHCILFWRASTHFLGGLGIIVLFVVILGQGSAGKALMRAEVPGPTQDNTTARTQHTAWLFAGMYIALNAFLAVIYFFLGMTVFDALCHSFATTATGGFSTYNASLGHFESVPGISGAAVEYVTILFMILAGTNFTLLALCVFAQPKKLIADVEWRTYIAIISVSTLLVVVVGLASGHKDFATLASSLRYGLFQVVSVITTTGYGTSDFNSWTHFSRGLLLVLMFVGGCAGSTGGGMKVIRHVLFVKILGIEIEQAFRPKVVRLLKLAGKPVEDENLQHSILVYFALIAMLFVSGFLFIVCFEPDLTWGMDSSNKLIDSASSIASTLNNIGPGLGTVGATENYGHFSLLSKSVFILMMMLGRLEIFPIIVLMSVRFWRDQ